MPCVREGGSTAPAGRSKTGCRPDGAKKAMKKRCARIFRAESLGVQSNDEDQNHKRLYCN